MTRRPGDRARVTARGIPGPVIGTPREIRARPWTLGGPSDLDNCRTLCGPCNRAKGAKILP